MDAFAIARHAVRNWRVKLNTDKITHIKIAQKYIKNFKRQFNVIDNNKIKSQSD